MTAPKPSSREAVMKALAAQGELTSTELAATAGLGRSTVTKTLAALERAGRVHRRPGGREGGRRLPDRWSLAPSGRRGPKACSSSTGRLRPGQLDELVLDFIPLQVGGFRGSARRAGVRPRVLVKFWSSAPPQRGSLASRRAGCRSSRGSARTWPHSGRSGGGPSSRANALAAIRASSSSA